MNADYGLIGKQISFYRHQVGLTQEQLAEACNLSVSYLNRIENGRKKASLGLRRTSFLPRHHAMGIAATALSISLSMIPRFIQQIISSSMQCLSLAISLLKQTS